MTRKYWQKNTITWVSFDTSEAKEKRLTGVRRFEYRSGIVWLGSGPAFPNTDPVQGVSHECEKGHP